MDYGNHAFTEKAIDILKSEEPEKILFVCSSENDRYGYRTAIDGAGFNCASFTSFEPFPEVSSVKKGVDALNSSGCDFIVTVGGGSAMDTAKAIKYFSKKDIKILAVPTTAGTGAEVTRFSVLYNNGDKESVNSFDIIPDYQVFDYTVLSSLSYEQKVVTALDAFCHSVEAFWSNEATDESREYSKDSLSIFSKNFDRYLKDDPSAYEPMMKCSELAGRAINIARTCAPHALSYKLHKIKGFHHGRAVAVCLAYIWKYTQEKFESPGINELFEQTEKITGFTSYSFTELLKSLGLCDNLSMTAAQLEETINGVNTDRLKNSPVQYTSKDIEAIYKSFLKV